MEKTAIILEIEKHLGFQLTHIHDIEAVMKEKYPPSYLEVMGIEFEMVGAVYSKTAFTDVDSNLVGLNLFDSGVTDAQLDFLLNEKSPMQLPHLLSLNLAKNPITHFEFLESFSSLVFAEFHECSNLEMVEIRGEFRDLARLELQDCNLKMAQIPASCQSLYYLDLSGNKELEGCKLDGSLESLQVLFIRGTSLESFELPDTFPNLVHLYLNSNKLKRLTLRGELPVLTTLQLRKNSLTDFSEQTIRFGDEEIENKNFFEIFQKICPTLDSVFLGENDLVSEELAGKVAQNEAGNHLDILRKHFKQRATGTPQPNNECKVLLIGNGKAGKSNILKRLLGDEFNKEWDSTHGIQIKKLELGEYDLFFWDFGGQDIYHSTHRMFMQKNAVYVLAWRKLTEENLFTDHKIPYKNGTILRKYRNYKLPYWLSYAHILGGDSPMNVVQTNIKEDGRINKEEDVPNRFGQYFQHLNFHQIELDGKQDYLDGVDALRESISQSVARIKAQKQTIAESLFYIREYLRGLKQPSLSYEEYEAKAKEFGVLDPLGELETWLFLSGVVYFKRGIFNNRLILDQQWAIKAIYMLFDREDLRTDDIRKNGGEFSGQFLKEIWAEEYPDAQVQEELVGFMKDCDICYEVESGKENPSFSERVFVAPKLLPDFKPSTIDDFWIREEKVHKKPIIHLKYTYNFLHARVIESVIVKTAYLADRWEVWQSGLQISEGQFKERVVEVEGRGNEIFLRFTHQSLPLVTRIRKLIEELQDEQGEVSISEKDNLWSPLAFSTVFSLAALGEGRLESAELWQKMQWLDDSDSEEQKSIKSFLKNTPQPVKQHPEKTIKDLAEKEAYKEALLRLRQLYPEGAVKLEEDKLSLEESFRNGKITLEDLSDHFEALKSSILEIIDEKIPNGSEKESQPLPAEKEKVNSILLMAAGPLDLDRIQTGKEFEELKKEMQLGEKRENFLLLDQHSSTELSTMLRALRKQPTIVHFAGHGEAEGVMLADKNNESVLLTNTTIENMFGRLSGVTELIILNACYSADQAEFLSRMGFYVFGTNYKVLDGASIEFSRGVYNALGDGVGYKEAFQDGKAMVDHYFPEDQNTFKAWHNGTLLPW